MDPTESASSPSPSVSQKDDLRRSKRKKQRLDYAAAANNGDLKKIKLEVDVLTVETEDVVSESGTEPDKDKESEVKDEGISPVEVRKETEGEEVTGKRTRRSTAPYRHFGFIYPDDGDDDDRGFLGNFLCTKCPARYESKGGLNNHMKLHSAEKRKFACDLCDFSSSTSKAIMQHSRLHKQFGVLSAQPSPVIPVDEVEKDKDAQNSVAPMLIAVSDEPYENHDDTPDGPICTPPPILVAEVLNRNGMKSESPPPTLTPPKPLRSRVSNNCPHCPFVGQSITRLRRHLKGHFLDRGYACPSKNCTYKCGTSGFLKRHYILHKEVLPWPPIYVESMPIIENKYQKRRRLRPLAQIKSKIGVADEEYESKCNVENCEFRTTSRVELISHKVRVHKAMESFMKKNLCFKCGFRASSVKQLRAHKLTRHVLFRRRFARSFYLKEIIGELYLIKHLSNITNNESGVEIKKEDADESLDNSFQMNDSQENGEEVYHCDLCPYKAVTANRVERHRAKHMVENEFSCQECSFSCRTDNALQQHVRLHTDLKNDVPKDLDDSQPGPSSSSKDEEEMNTDTTCSSSDSPPEVPKTDYNLHLIKLRDTISVWTKKVIDSRKLVNDNFTKVTIDGQKVFLCVECPYTSKYRGDIRTHKSRHAERQDYRCTQCSYTAQRPVSLREHLKQHVTANASVKEKNESTKITVNESFHIGDLHGRGKSRMYCCSLCPYVTPAVGSLYRHNRLHKKVPQVHVCSTCSYSSIDKTKMDEHILIHAANGKLNTYVRRVNKDGLTIPMITDFSFDNSAALNNNAPHLSPEGPNQEVNSGDGPSGSGSSVNPQVKSLKKESKTSGRSTPKKSVSPPAGRQPSERSTRSKNNYYLMVNNPNSRGNSRISTPTPSGSTYGLFFEQGFESRELTEAEKKQQEDSIELTHFQFRDYLRKERKAEESRKCPDCPYTDSDLLLFKLHRDMHFDDGKVRPHSCCCCNYSCYTPAALKHHLKLHAPVGELNEPSYLRKRQVLRKTEIIPMGVRSFDCSTCSYRTVDYQAFYDHRLEHVRVLSNKMSTQMKRSARDEYLKPKKKFDARNRNVKYCNKCMFQCNTLLSYVAHTDRHGWNQLYKCRMCDYSDATKKTVEFHETHHHVTKEVSLVDVETSLKFKMTNGFVDQPGLEGIVKPTNDEFMKSVGTSLKCSFCDYITNVSEELSFHINQKHMSEENAKEASSFLQMGFYPPTNTVSSSC